MRCPVALGVQRPIQGGKSPVAAADAAAAASVGVAHASPAAFSAAAPGLVLAVGLAAAAPERALVRPTRRGGRGRQHIPF